MAFLSRIAREGKNSYRRWPTSSYSHAGKKNQPPPEALIKLFESLFEIVRIGLVHEQVQQTGGLLAIVFHGIGKGSQDFGGVSEVHAKFLFSNS